VADKTTLGARPVKVRHVKRSQSGTTVLGTVYAGDWDGLAGRGGFVSGTFERRLYEEGTGTLRLPNAAGSDGRLHRDRFACLTDPGYLPGDEWLEVYEDGDLVAVWTPTGRQSKRRGELQISGEDATTLLKRTRESTVGYWNHAPRDVMEHYGRTWQVLFADEFDAAGQFTYSTSVQSTGGGFQPWSYERCETDQANYPGVVRLIGGPTGTSDDAVMTSAFTPAVEVGSTNPDPHGVFRVEAVVTPESFGTGYLTLAWQGGILQVSKTKATVYNNTDFVTGLRLTDGQELHLAIERRERFSFFFVNGQMIGSAPNFVFGTSQSLWVRLSAVAMTVRARVASVRYCSRLLIDDGDGDLALPGSPTPGGLLGDYYDYSQYVGTQGVTEGVKWVFLPQDPPAATRLDTQVNFASANPPAWRPSSMPAEYFSARWTGSIYLDLSNADVALRVISDDDTKVWVGRTRAGEEVLSASSSTTASTWLKAGSSSSSGPSGATGPLAGQASGWYPILVEYQQRTGAGGCQLQMETSAAVGTWAAVTSNVLSPYGIYRDLVRSESHYDALKNVADTFGYQWTCEPKSLESTKFPGRITPRTRIGRNTERVLDEPETVDIQADIDLDSRADRVLADASGLADPDGAAQLSAEVVDYPAALTHLLLGESYESLSDISDRQLLQQRLNTLVTLRSAVWEEISARPPGRRELLDSWPLTGSLAEFAWSPGDGIRLNFPTVGVVDTLPRQILGLSRELTPSGMKPPAASFRPRPRSIKSLMREVRRTALLPQRNYQQQLATVVGSIGGHGASTGGVDEYSRIALPADQSRIVKLELCVLQKSDASAWWAEVNLISGAPVPTNLTVVGRYDISGLNIPAPGGFNVARLVTGGTGTGNWIVQLQALVRV